MKYISIKTSLVVLFGLTLLQLNANNTSILNCEAYFTYEAYDGPSPVFGGVTFKNESVGDYQNISWDFGDGVVSNDGNDIFDYFYASDGVYQVCLTIWNDQGCLNTFCSDVIVGNLSDICNLTDCVFPGDANHDGEANFYDLLELGIGNEITGPIRPDATTDWVGQLAPDWSQTTPEGVNYKHLDCDGNGIINSDDAIAINLNYQVMDAPNPNTETTAPLIHIEFDQDTIYVDDAMLMSNIEITAHLKVGNSTYPANDIYGLAMYLGYPSDLVYEDSIFFGYDTNSFFGLSDEVLWMPSNQYDESQIDIGITRNDGFPSSGHGRVGETVFIINADILDGRIDDGVVHFPVAVNGVKMVDVNGDELPINLTNTPATLVFIKTNANITSTNAPELAEKIELFPNPATDKVNIDLGELNGEKIEIFDQLGQRLLNQNIEQTNMVEIPTKNWNVGVYLIKIQTIEGVVTKRFVLK